MHSLNLILCIAIALGVGTALQSQAQPSVHDHAAETTQAPPARRFATDAPLREGMALVHRALDELAHYEMGHMPQSAAIERVDTIKSATEFLFANCKLDARADAALHGMLAPLLNGVQAFRSNPDDRSTIAAMRHAVANYPGAFDDPQWPPTVGPTAKTAD